MTALIAALSIALIITLIVGALVISRLLDKIDERDRAIDILAKSASEDDIADALHSINWEKRT